jgi:flagellar motor switch protein FliN
VSADGSQITDDQGSQIADHGSQDEPVAVPEPDPIAVPEPEAIAVPEPEAEPAAGEEPAIAVPEAAAEEAAAIAVPESPDPAPETPAVQAPPVAVPEEEQPAEEEEPDLAAAVAGHLLDVNVRLWAELGRSKLALGSAVSLGTGAIVDLDKAPDEALDVFVNGRLFARGRLLLVDGEWAVRLEKIVASPTAVEHASNAGSAG